jgi:tRNA1Val (adenine37-N6)-methyltransferase
MKVCTDACLFGAWVAERLAGTGLISNSILDIGTGTGLLSLMLAQKNLAKIDAIELDEAAAQQAKENFENSPWFERMQLISGDARLLHFGKKYDLVISNPPFFDNDLKSSDPQRNMALHGDALDFDALIKIVSANLAENGRFALLLPFHRRDEFVEKISGKGFFLQEEASVKQSGRHAFFRSLLIFGNEAGIGFREEIIIREEEAYSERFTSLLKDYYLNF